MSKGGGARHEGGERPWDSHGRPDGEMRCASGSWVLGGGRAGRRAPGFIFTCGVTRLLLCLHGHIVSSPCLCYVRNLQFPMCGIDPCAWYSFYGCTWYHTTGRPTYAKYLHLRILKPPPPDLLPAGTLVAGGLVGPSPARTPAPPLAFCERTRG